VVVTPEHAALARRLGAEGATVVVTGPDTGEVGSLLRDIRDAGGRAACFVTDGDGDADRKGDRDGDRDEYGALVDFLEEQFR
jgi:NAD(P)-dependent dehydrogenase (short-subunit alcohol dehydrogenase family)